MSAKTPPVKAQPEVIFFDAAGTLIRLAEPVGRHYARIARRHGLDVAEEDCERAFRAAWKARPSRPASPGPRPEDDRPWWRRLALEVITAAGPPPANFDAGAWFDDLYEHFEQPGVWRLFDDVAPALARLGTRHRLAVISNFDGRLRRILDDLGVLGAFEHLIISSEAGCEKPDPAIFQKAAAALRAQPSACLHVGDDPACDWHGAQAAAFSIFALERPARTLAEVLPATQAAASGKSV